jgi:hypothetical protein
MSSKKYNGRSAFKGKGEAFHLNLMDIGQQTVEQEINS